MRIVLFVLLLGSSAVADPLTISYRRQERRVNYAFADTLVFDLRAAEIVGDILLPGSIQPLSTWRTILAKNAIGQVHTLTAADPEFAGFRTAAPHLDLPRTHLLLMMTPVGEIDLHSHDTWPVPISPAVIPPSFALDRVEVQLAEYFTSPIGSVMQWDVRLIGSVPEPATAGLMLMLCLSCLHLRLR